MTLASLFVGGLSGLFLERHRFWGRDAVVGLITLPLSFPGVVVGFMIIMLGESQRSDRHVYPRVGCRQRRVRVRHGRPFLGLSLLFDSARCHHCHGSGKENGSDVRRSGPNTRSLVVPYSQGRHSSSSGSCSLFHRALCFATSMGAFGTPLRLRPTSMFCRSRFTRNLRFRPTSPLRQCFQ